MTSDAAPSARCTANSDINRVSVGRSGSRHQAKGRFDFVPCHQRRFAPTFHPSRPGRCSGGSGLPGELRAEARRGDRHRGARGGPAGVMQLGEVRREGHVVELAAVEPGIEAAERAGVGPPGVRADGGLDQAARGRRRPPDHGLFGVGPGGLIIHV